ncbi:MAG: hypothetical protein LBD42_03675 [Desulfovibrio sp.]|jgi:hypothetical protein|nr:hypothetical protein [Desulfovibrio sp.]
MTQQTASYDNVPVYTGMPVQQDNNGFFQPPAPSAGAGHALASVAEVRAIAEVQASMAIAKRFPRDELEAYTRILNACKRLSLAENATYAYPRGETTVVTGPSIRLAEVLANAWGNIDYGYREVGSGPGYTDVEAYAFDKESNTRSCRTFRVPHIRYTKYGNNKLKDPRDVYEVVASNASRRIRACILQIIPGDITEEAMNACKSTLKKSCGDVTLVDRVRKMSAVFQEYGVTTEMLERRLGHRLDATIEQDLVQLRSIYTSIRDGAAKREDFFDLVAASPECGQKPEQAKEEPKQEKKAQEQNPPAGKSEAKPAPKQTAQPAQEEPALAEEENPEGEGFADPFDGGQFVTCPNNGKQVDEFDCLQKPCRNGCQAFLE